MNRDELLQGLNDRQKEAVQELDGPLLILAGAGSGKTRVLTHRIGYLIESGVSPWNILAITFTNKAAGEMRERVNALLESRAAQQVFVSTFHSMCVRLLRRDIDKLGYDRDFTIYDTDDQRTLVRNCIKSLELDTKMYKDRAVLSIISSNKNEMVDAEAFAAAAGDFYERNVARIFAEYERQMKANNALDFDDLLVKTVELFAGFPEVLENWQERFHYIMVDEYQDTNNVQFEIVRLLADRYHNLCVVGDDDQSIYKFRGANIENILSFERSFPGAKVIRLEQNYRSTKSILRCANEVIKNNKERKIKELWTDNEEGSLPVYHEYDTAAAEAAEIVRQAAGAASRGIPLKNQAVLYRTNAQSRLLEEKCVGQSIPYVIVGGVNFYQRKEIKDILSYLRIIANSVDDLACQRVINVPKRGIGQTSVDRVSAFAAQQTISFYEALLRPENIPGLGAAARKIRGFTDEIEGFKKRLADGELDLKQLIEAVRDETGYLEELEKEDPITAKTRLENIEEMISKAVDFEKNHAGALPDTDATALSNPDIISDAGAAPAFSEGFVDPAWFFVDETSDAQPSHWDGIALLSSFLEEVSLVADIDRTDENSDVLTMMTLHAAKGLEFDIIYLCGMEDGLFPSSASINAERPEEEIEEERRLCYVGFTRAKKELFLSSARERMVNGETRYMKVSRFVEEIPEGLCKLHFKRKSSAGESFRGFGGYEGRMERSYDLGDFKDQRGSYGFGGGYGANGGFGSTYGSRDSEAAKSAYRAYNDFDNRMVGRFGSLDHDPRGKGSAGSGSYGRGGQRGSKAKSLQNLPGVTKGFGAASARASVKQKPDYGPGDRVAHVKFGKGTVQSVTEGTKDYEVSVDFDEVGVKRMFAGFAKLQKI